MKKPEIYLLFTTLLIGVAISMVALFKFIKPAKTTLIIDDYTEKSSYEQEQKSGWIEKISKNSQDFSYPVTIYKLKL